MDSQQKLSVKGPRLGEAVGEKSMCIRQGSDGEKVLTPPPHGFSMPIPSLINISFILNIGWKYFYIKEKVDLFFKALEGEHKIKGARIGVS